MKNKIIVFGGTFNPLSKAHGKIIQYLIKRFKVDKFIILPTNDSFLHCWKHFEGQNILPTWLRIKILNEFAKRNKKVIVEMIEVEGKTFKTFDSLNLLQQKYPDSEIMFVFGSEKADELHRRYKIEELLNKYKIILIRRNYDDLDKLFEANDFLRTHKNDFILLSSKDYLQEISSTKIREALKNKDTKKVYELTYNYVVKILKDEGYL